jgi:hypothetical protein
LQKKNDNLNLSVLAFFEVPFQQFLNPFWCICFFANVVNVAQATNDIKSIS